MLLNCISRLRTKYIENLVNELVRKAGEVYPKLYVETEWVREVRTIRMDSCE